jgi:hypothetical protein
VDIILFTGVGIVLYLLCDRLLVLLEKMHGEPLPGRNIVFFVLILALSLSAFSLMRTLLHPGESTQYDNQEQQATDGGDQSAQPH